MKTAGIIVLIIGILSILGALVGSSQGHDTSLAGIVFVIIGAILMSQGNKKKEEKNKR